ncbi:MAG: metallophosphoesterase, partial [Solirubrobacteraceae bacterium]
MTRTLVISDLHLGAGSGADVLRRPDARTALIEALADIDQLVLLGDVLELRHGPRRDALAAARPFFEELGRSFADRDVVVVAGNHDHALTESWLRSRDESPDPKPLGLE